MQYLINQFQSEITFGIPQESHIITLSFMLHKMILPQFLHDIYFTLILGIIPKNMFCSVPGKLGIHSTSFSFGS